MSLKYSLSVWFFAAIFFCFYPILSEAANRDLVLDQESRSRVMKPNSTDSSKSPKQNFSSSSDYQVQKSILDEKEASKKRMIKQEKIIMDKVRAKQNARHHK